MLVCTKAPQRGNADLLIHPPIKMGTYWGGEKRRGAMRIGLGEEWIGETRYFLWFMCTRDMGGGRCQEVERSEWCSTEEQ